MAASCRTWFMTAVLGSDEAEKPRLLLTLSISAICLYVDWIEGIGGV
jgi:hypothetical protein